MSGKLQDALIASRWWPPDEPLSESLRSLKVGDDLLPILRVTAGRWMTRASKPADKRAATQLTLLHQQLAETGAKLTFGWPGLDDRRSDQWIGLRLLWWPSGIPSGRKVAWVSSRLGRAIDERSDWFAVLRSAAAKLDSAQDLLLTAPSTTTDRFLERAAVLFGLRVLRVHLDETHSLADWLLRLRRQMRRQYLESARRAGSVRLPMTEKIAESLDRTSYAVSLSPLSVGWDSVPTNSVSSKGSGRSPNLRACVQVADAPRSPLADRVLVAAADQIMALQIRAGGQLHELLKQRLADSFWPAGSVWLALGEQLVPSEVADDLQSLGAVGWSLWPKTLALSAVEQAARLLDFPIDSVGNPVGFTGEPPVLRLSEMPWPEGSYLVHWTRRRSGPWPEQSAADFLDDMLLSRGERSHSAFAALVRIARQRQLVASSTGIRGASRVVSFSATPLSELPRQRVFRPHRGRWDFECFGICVRREWLEQRGARPVVYGDESDWPAVIDGDRPYWQLRQTRSRDGAKSIDWSVEAEWRVADDLDLSQIPRDAVLLFAPSESDARQLAAISPWPVVALGTE